MVQPMCFPSLIARPFCFSALFPGLWLANYYLSIYGGCWFFGCVVFFFYPFFLSITGASKKRWRTLHTDLAALRVSSALSLSSPCPCCTSPRGANSQGRAAASNRFTSELTQGKVKAGNLLWPQEIWKPPPGEGFLMWQSVVSAGGGCGSPGDTAPSSSQSNL